MNQPVSNQKHCSRLWNGLVIRHTGKAYPCCQHTRDDMVLGDIHRQPLEEIINSPTIQGLRAQSLQGTLPCYEGCDQAKYYESYPIPRPQSTRSEISNYADLQIEYGELCNVDCIMCWQDRNNRTVLPFEVLERNLPLESWKLVNVYGGEIFAMKDAMRHVDLMSAAGKNVMMTTNGKLLSNPRMAEWTIQRFNSIIISINAMTEETHTRVMRPKTPFFRQLLQSIKSLQQLKHDLNRPHFTISGHFTTVIESLDEFPLFIERFEEMGLDTATIGFDHRHFPRYFHENPEVVGRLRPKVKSALESVADPGRVTLCHHGVFFDEHHI